MASRFATQTVLRLFALSVAASLGAVVPMRVSGAQVSIGAVKATSPASKTPAKTTAAPKPVKTLAVGPAELAAMLDEAVSGSTKSGSWGVMVVSLTRGDTLFGRNADVLMAPASTMKMYTAAVALDRFGPDYVFKTPVLQDGVLGPDGVLQGNLYLRGTGDPSLSVRFWKGDAPMDGLARQIAGAGIKQVRGDIVGDATLFDGQLIPDGWKTTYLGAAYAARVAALSLNEGLLWVLVQPEGKTAKVSLDPASTTIPIVSTVRVVAGKRGSITAVRRADGAVVVKGTIGSSAPPQRYSLVADDPPTYVVGAFRAALERAGIGISGATRLGATPEGAQAVATVASPPLGQIIGEMNRESINVVAEMLFKTAAATSTQIGSAATALSSLRQFLGEKVGLHGNVVDVADGSGLSQLDRVTPRSMVALLGYAHAAPWSATFHASLPVEGESGTLKNRKGTPARGNLHAKTGTTNTVASLGGYVTARNGEVLAFSFVYNGTDRWNAKSAMDRMGATMAEWVR
jgi:D-alanyl-D-alanine carboxypeptidase/D-alanyl-D-alanine-endopeptidase (penicillin-binding protein 4)